MVWEPKQPKRDAEFIPTPDMNRKMRQMNKSKRVQKKALKVFKQKFPGMDMDNIHGEILVDGVRIRGAKENTDMNPGSTPEK